MQFQDITFIRKFDYASTILCTLATWAYDAQHVSNIYWNGYVPIYGIVHGQLHNQLYDEEQV